MNIKKMLSRIIFPLICWTAQAEIVKSIDVQGLRLVSPDTVASHLVISVGQDIEASDLKYQIIELYETGLFRQVEVSLEDHVLVIRCEEQPILRSIVIEDEGGVLPEDQIKKQLEAAGIIKAEIINETALEEFRVGSQYSLRQYGFSNAVVETKIEDLGESTARLRLIVHEGESTKLKAIEFEGDLKTPERELRRLLSSQTTGMLSFYTMNDLFSEQQLYKDRERLLLYYQSKGYLAPSIQLEIEDVEPMQRIWESNYKKARFTIDTGPKFYVDTIKFDNTIDEWPEPLRQRILSDINGKVLDHELLQGLKRTLVQYYADEPLRDFYQIEVDHEIQGYDKVHIQLVLNKQISRVRYISFYGNRSTFDEPMRRALVIQEAKPFNTAMLIQTERALNNLGYLKSVDITPVKVDEGLYDIEIKVHEASTLQADARLDFGSGPMALSFSASDPNAFGTGNSAALSISGGFDKQQISASYVQPYFTPSGHTMSNVMSYTRQSKADKDRLSYHVDTFSYALGYSIPMSRTFMVDFGGGVLLDQYHEIDQAPSIVRDFFETHDTYVKQFKVSGGLSYRDINSAYMPTKGIIFNTNAVVTLPHHDSVTYLQTMAEGITYYPLGEMFDQPIVLRTRLLGKFVTDYTDNTEDIAFFARYFAGGLGTVRGYTGLGPTYQNKIVQKAISEDVVSIITREVEAVKGGNKLLVGTVEVQMPSPSPDYLTPYLFIDMGNVFDDSENISLAKMRGSAGLSMTARTPMFTITASLAMPFNNKASDNFQPFSFGMGVMF